MPADLEQRPYRPGDETAICALFELAFRKPLSPAFWQWRFAANPVGEILIDLMWDGGVLAGHYAVSPVVMKIGEREWRTALSMTTMTHPSYQGRGIFTTLASSLYARMAETGYAMVWGFPNYVSHRGFVRDLAWEDVYEVPTFRLTLAEARRVPAATAAVGDLAGFDERFDELWRRMRDAVPVMTRRDRAYLDWRYARHPENRYTILGHTSGGALTGYAVFKRFEQDIDLVDVVAVDVAAGTDLVAGVIARALSAGCQGVNAWVGVATPLHSAMEKLGFRIGGPVTYLGARPLAAGVGADVKDSRSWHISMGDSDVF